MSKSHYILKDSKSITITTVDNQSIGTLLEKPVILTYLSKSIGTKCCSTNLLSIIDFVIVVHIFLVFNNNYTRPKWRKFFNEF